MSGINLSMAVVQMDCVLADTEKNLQKIGDFARLAGRLGVDIVIFPECATTGYFLGSRLADLAEPVDGPTTAKLSAMARDNGVHLAVGAFTRKDNGIYNSQLLFSPAGKLLAVYDKAHLFASEREFCQRGEGAQVVDTALGKIGMTICYDLIFPDYVRHIVDRGADFVINSTDWINDTYQRETWGFSGPVTQGVAATRALENLTVVAMANRVGLEHANPELAFTSFGYSCIAGPSGKVLASITEGEGIAISRINISDDEMKRWTGIATYKIDRRPELLG